MTTIALGTMNFGKRTPAAESERILARALERGVTFIDTANVYNDGESERIVGKAIAGAKARARVTLASKVAFGKGSDGKPEGLSAAAIARAIDLSLARLGTDYLDIYYLHRPDYATPIEETLEAMHKLLDAQKIRAWGVSNYAAWQILDMMRIADSRGMARPRISQVIYNVVLRDIEIEYLPFAKKHSIETTIYNPLAGGLLTGKHASPRSSDKGSRFENNALYQKRYWTDAMFERVEQLKGVASKEGMSLVDLAYAWVAHRPGVDSVIAGPATEEQLDAAIDGCEKTLSDDAKKTIDALWLAWRGTDTTYVR